MMCARAEKTHTRAHIRTHTRARAGTRTRICAHTPARTRTHARVHTRTHARGYIKSPCSFISRAQRITFRPRNVPFFLYIESYTRRGREGSGYRRGILGVKVLGINILIRPAKKICRVANCYKMFSSVMKRNGRYLCRWYEV